jgi:hypothetical protein
MTFGRFITGSLAISCLHASTTAVPTLASIIEPPCTGAFGMSVSPSSKVHPFDWQPECIGRQLRHSGVRSRPHIARCGANHRGVIGKRMACTDAGARSAG